MISIAHILNPDCFVLSGGLAKFIDYDLIAELLQDSTLPAIGKDLKVYRSELGEHTGIIGAAQLVLDKLAKSAQ